MYEQQERLAGIYIEKELDKIPQGYHPVNSYEKIRMEYTDATRKAIICIDIYPWGAYLEIEADNIGVIKAISGELGYDSVEPVRFNADETYLLWIKENGLPEQWHVRFGLVEPSDF